MEINILLYLLSDMNKKLTVKELIILSMLAVIIFTLKLALSILPNIEVVTFLLILFSSIIGKKTYYIVTIYVLLEVFYFGFGFWTLGYLFLWPFLVICSIFLKRILQTSNIARAILAGVFGFCFDMFYAFIIMLFAGVWAGITYFLSGIVFSVVHMLGNYFIMLCLGEKIYAIVNRLYLKTQQGERGL